MQLWPNIVSRRKISESDLPVRLNRTFYVAGSLQRAYFFSPAISLNPLRPGFEFYSKIAPRSRAQRRLGFTLLELLVTKLILIIASLLFPTLSRAKERARRTSCANNIRQFILAAQMYAHDDNDFLPRTEAFCTAMMTKKCLTNFLR
jgi:competence protein ComGC